MKKLMYGMLMAVVFFSCEKEIDVEIPSEAPRFVLNSVFVSGKQIYADASKSKFILETGDIVPIQDAEITVWEDGIELGLMQPYYEGEYQLNHTVKEGSTYSFSASAPGVKTVSASTTVPQKVEIKAIELDSSRFEGEDYYVIRFTIDDPSIQNFYNIRLMRKTSVFNSGDTLVDYSTLEYDGHFDPALDGLVWEYNRGAYVNDNLFNGGEYQFSIRTYRYSISGSNQNMKNEFLVFLYATTEADFKYNVALAKYWDTEGDPFSEPVQIPGNVTHGLGIVAGKSGTSATVEVP